MTRTKPREIINTLRTVCGYRGLTVSERMRVEEAAELLDMWSEAHIIQRVDLLVADSGYLELREAEGFTPVLIHVRGVNRDTVGQGHGQAILNTGTGRFIRELSDYNKEWRIWDEIPEKTQSWERASYFGRQSRP